MKERTHTTATSVRDEPWPTIEARWPNAIWLSPWAFDGEEPAANERDGEEQDWDRRVRH